jgi:DNA polymerase-3 subunit beta
MSDKLRIPVNCSVESDYMKISCKTTFGAIDEEISVSILESDFSGFNINFNPRFMLDALQKTNCDEVKICFDGSLKPFKITPVEDNGEFIFIIVPIRSS